ncbi:MAG TPA: hypothetical protein VF037_05575 [Gemmatimonadales bacterium]
MTRDVIGMELWLKLVLGTLSLLAIAQMAGGKDRALRARRWSGLAMFPLMGLSLAEILGWVQLPAGYLWRWLGILVGFDQLVSEIRLDWRNWRRRRAIAE